MSEYRSTEDLTVEFFRKFYGVDLSEIDKGELFEELLGFAASSTPAAYEWAEENAVFFSRLNELVD